MVIMSEVARQIYVYAGTHSILSRILAAVVVLQFVFLSSFLGAATVPRRDVWTRMGGARLGRDCRDGAEEILEFNLFSDPHTRNRHALAKRCPLYARREAWVTVGQHHAHVRAVADTPLTSHG